MLKTVACEVCESLLAYSDHDMFKSSCEPIHSAPALPQRQSHCLLLFKPIFVAYIHQCIQLLKSWCRVQSQFVPLAAHLVDSDMRKILYNITDVQVICWAVGYIDALF